MNNKTQKMFVGIFLVTSWITIIYGQCQERCKNNAQIIYDQRYLEGEVLTCKTNIGLNMCIETCAHTGGCQFLNYDSNMLLCDLMGYNEYSKTDFQIQHGQILALMSNTSDLCDSNVCRSGYIRLQTASGRNTCAPIDRKCCEERFLVTGPFGVNADRVTFSSVHPGHSSYTNYTLNSTSSWVAGSNLTEQWIQVLFLSRKIVVGVVTLGRYGINQWVKSYQVKYKDLSGAWKYFKDKAGVVAKHLLRKTCMDSNSLEIEDHI